MYSFWKGASGVEARCCRGLAKVRARALLTALLRQAMDLLIAAGVGRAVAVAADVFMMSERSLQGRNRPDPIP